LFCVSNVTIVSIVDIELKKKPQKKKYERVKKNHTYTKKTAAKNSCTFVIFALGKGKKRLFVLEEVHPLQKNDDMRWVPGRDCGWTRFGLCFSADWRGDIHDNYIVPFKFLVYSLYVDQPADSDAFGLKSAVLVRFSKKRDAYWEARVLGYSMGWDYKKRKIVTYRIIVRTEFIGLKEQLQESFSPNQARLKGNI